MNLAVVCKASDRLTMEGGTEGHSTLPDLYTDCSFLRLVGNNWNNNHVAKNAEQNSPGCYPVRWHHVDERS